MRTQTADNTVAGLTAEVKRLEKDLRQADEEIGAFQRTNSVMMSQDQDNSTSVCLAALKQRLTAQRSEYELLQMLTPDQSLDRQQETGWALPQAGDAASKPWAAVSERTDADYFKVKQQLLLLQAEHEEMGHYLRTKHPKMVAMSEEIARQERLLKVFRMQSVEQLEVKKVSLKLEIHNLEREVKQWEVQMVENQHKTLEDQWKIAEYQKLKSNAQRTQAFYDRLLATMQTLDVNKEISPESVVIMEPASRAFREQSAVWIKKASGAFIGLVLVVALLLLFDLLDDRMTSLAELKAAFDEDVVGHIPREKSRGPEREVALIQPGDKRPRFVKAYRNLRSSLLCMAGTEAWPKTLLVTSSVPNEGKSLTSANLALTMANAGSRVLLVDADMCKGALHERFHLPSKPGLSQVLTQRVHWEEAVQPTQFPNLFLLPQGGPLPKGCDLFLNEAAERFLRDVAAKYDFVILDTVPVMAEEGDVTRLAPHVEGVLFVIRAEFTSACVAHAALDILYQSKVRVLGLLFNSARSRFEDYYYYRQRDYYTKYPAEAASPKAETQQIGKG
jgi:capsular exopolysaccharide synthesis family protein